MSMAMLECLCTDTPTTVLILDAFPTFQCYFVRKVEEIYERGENPLRNPWNILLLEEFLKIEG